MSAECFFWGAYYSRKEKVEVGCLFSNSLCPAGDASLFKMESWRAREEEAGGEPRTRQDAWLGGLVIYCCKTCFAIVAGGRRSLARTSPIVLPRPPQADFCSPGGSSVLLLACVKLFLLVVFALCHRRSSAADSGPCQRRFPHVFFVWVFFIYFFFTSTSPALSLRFGFGPLNANQICAFLGCASRSCLARKGEDGCASVARTLLAPCLFCLTGAQSVPEHVWCQWRNAFPFISGIMSDG